VTTSGLAWKTPGRVGESAIPGAGLYLDGSVGAVGSTGRGEANLCNLSSFFIVEEMRHRAHPKDAAIALRRVVANTVDSSLLNSRGLAELRSELLRVQYGAPPSTVPPRSYGTSLRREPTD
jgi:N4-(beta-N-acetylglucosaminyl)-L-asparaginase